MLIVDSHLDLAYNAIEFNRDLRQSVREIRSSESEMKGKGRGANTVSLPALREGGLGLCFVTAHSRVTSCDGRFPGVRTQEIAYSKAQGEAAYYRILEQDGWMRMIRDTASLDAHLEEWNQNPQETPIGYVLCMEGADPIVRPEQVAEWWQLGLRIVSLVHYGVSAYAHGTQAPGGLLPAGKILLRTLEEQGMILDASHMADGTFSEAMDLFGGQVIATHNCCRALVPHDRQFTDEQIKTLGERGGVIGVAFDAWMLSPEFDKSAVDNSQTRLATVVDHIDHICQVTGNARHAALGTDLDGGYGREQSPSDLNTIADLQKIPAILEERGYASGDVASILHGNWIGLLRHVWGSSSG